MLTRLSDQTMKIISPCGYQREEPHDLACSRSGINDGQLLNEQKRFERHHRSRIFAKETSIENPERSRDSSNLAHILDPGLVQRGRQFPTTEIDH